MYRRQESRPSPRKRNAKKQNGRDAAVLELGQAESFCHGDTDSRCDLSHHAGLLVAQSVPDFGHVMMDGQSKHPLPTAQEKTLHMDITRWSTLKSD